MNKNRTQLSLKGPLADKIAYSKAELKDVIFGKGFGGITDIEIVPDGYIYVLAVSEFRPLTSPLNKNQSQGTVFRIVPTNTPAKNIDRG